MMVTAHRMAKQMVGNYSARLSLALTQLWASLKKGVAKTMLVLKYQQHLVSKKWAEMTHTEKIAERELTLSEDVKLGYSTVQEFETQLQKEIKHILAN